MGWGAHLGTHRTQGLWSPKDLSLHINVRELRAVHLACQVFQTHLEGNSMSVLTDNTTAGQRTLLSPMPEALQLWEFSIAHSIHLEVSYFPGSHKLVDHLSRSFPNHHEWSICPDTVSTISQRWGTPQVDLFVTKHNRKCLQFCYFLATAWSHSQTPFSSLGQTISCMRSLPSLSYRVLLKVRRDRTRPILIAPAMSALIHHPPRSLGGHANQPAPVPGPDLSGPRLCM